MAYGIVGRVASDGFDAAVAYPRASGDAREKPASLPRRLRVTIRVRMRREGTNVASSVEHHGLYDRIRAAYGELAPRPRAWVELKQLRAKLGDAPRGAVDSALKQMYLAKQINLTLNEDQASLTHEDREAAVRIGMSDMHFLSID